MLFCEIRFAYHQAVVKILDKLFIKGEKDISKMNRFQKLVVKVMQRHYGIAYKIFYHQVKKWVLK